MVIFRVSPSTASKMTHFVSGRDDGSKIELTLRVDFNGRLLLAVGTAPDVLRGDEVAFYPNQR